MDSVVQSIPERMWTDDPPRVQDPNVRQVEAVEVRVGFLSSLEKIDVHQLIFSNREVLKP